MASSDLATGAILLLITFVILVLTALIGGAFISAIGQEDVATADPSTGSAVNWSDDGDGEPDHWVVSPTTGNGVYLTGEEDSYVSATLQDNLSTGPWTAGTWVEIDEDANLDATMDVVAVDDANILIQYDDGDWIAYADNGTADAVARTTADSPTTPTTVVARSDGSSIDLFVDGTLEASSNLSTNSTTRNVSVSLQGTIDETRVTNSSVSSSLISTYADKPTYPWNNTDRVGRFMLDEGEGTTSTVFFASSDATLSNTAWTSGVDRQTLEAGTDYEVDWDTWEITALAGGDIDGAPIVYLFYANGYFGAITSIESTVSNAIVLFGVSLLVIPAVALITYLVDRKDNIIRLGDWGNRRR